MQPARVQCAPVFGAMTSVRRMSGRADVPGTRDGCILKGRDRAVTTGHASLLQGLGPALMPHAKPVKVRKASGTADAGEQLDRPERRLDLNRGGPAALLAAGPPHNRAAGLASV